MSAPGPLSDSDHPAVRDKAAELASGTNTSREKAAAIFSFVRDGVPFGFPPEWDAVKASDTLQYGLGYCNTKATLFRALCGAAGVPARLHAGLIDLQIMRGIFPSFAFPFLPASGGHSWVEIEIDGEWRPLDSYINDAPFYERALRRLRDSGGPTGFSVSLAAGAASCEFNFGDRGFVHMGAVVEDHGTWDDYGHYMASDRYRPLNRMQALAYPALAGMANRRVARIRAGR